MRFTLPPAIIVLLVMIAASARGQNTSIITVESADSLIGRVENGTQYRELSGNVRMRQGRVLIHCDHAVQDLDHNSAELIGNVVILQDTLTMRTRRGMYFGDTKQASTRHGIYLNDRHVTLTSDIGEYNTDTKIADFASRVRVEDTASTILCNGLRYMRDSSKAIASGSVVILFKHENASITADTAIHYHKQNLSIFPRNPFLLQVDTAVVRRDSVTMKPDSIRLDTLTVISRTMEAHRDSSNVFLADGAVQVVRAKLAALCGRLTYFRNDSLIILQTKPVAWYEDNQVTGDSMTVQLANGKVRTMDVFGNAMAISKSRISESDSLSPPGRWDQSKGRNIRLVLQENKAKRIRIETTAISLYYLYDGRALNGVRRESGDLIIIDFKDGKADQIRTVNGIEGRYFPEKLVTGVESTYNLDGFILRKDRPVLDAARIRRHLQHNPQGAP